MSTTLRPLSALVALVTLAACGGGTDTSDSPSKLQPLSTAIPTAAPNSLLADSIRVKVLTADDRPVPNATVQWVPKIGGGTAGAGTTVTNADGISANSWRLGPDKGEQTLEVSIPGTAVPSVTMHAVAEDAGGGGGGGNQ
jgi:hypothetical protein